MSAMGLVHKEIGHLPDGLVVRRPVGQLLISQINELPSLFNRTE